MQLRRKQTVKYDSLEMDVITSIGDTAASLGLVSTLIFSIAVSVVLEAELDGREASMMCMCSAISMSTYTTTYSLLEYYYTTTIKGLGEYVANEVPEDIQTEPANDDVRRALTQGSLGNLIQTCLDGFASFNNMRGYARNSTWGSFVFMLLSTLMKFHPHALDECWTAAGFFLVVFILTAWAQAIGFGSADIKAYTAVSAVGMVASSAVSYFVDPNFEMAKWVCTVVLFCGVAAVTYSVKSYRVVFRPLVMEHAKVY
jgi:hypothetical protein